MPKPKPTITMSAAEYSAAVGKPKAQVLKWCREKRIPGARKNRDGEWRIPLEAVPIGGGKRPNHGADDPGFIGVAEFAKIHGRTPARVRQLLYENRIEGAYRDDYGWHIPEGALWPEDPREIMAGDIKPFPTHPHMPGSSSIGPVGTIE